MAEIEKIVVALRCKRCDNTNNLNIYKQDAVLGHHVKYHCMYCCPGGYEHKDVYTGLPTQEVVKVYDEPAQTRLTDML